jgi:DNA-binding transcriptional MocR family regulator
MTPAEDARFIQLRQAGTETAALAQQLGIPRGTVSSRAYALAKQGKISPRPKGGNYPRSKAQGRQEGIPAPPWPPRHPRRNGRTFSSGPCGSRRPSSRT